MLERLEQQRKLTLNQCKIMVAAVLGDMLDFFDYFLIGYVLAFIVHDWDLTYGQSVGAFPRYFSIVPLGPSKRQNPLQTAGIGAI